MKQILLLVSLFISSVMIAGEVTEQEALKKAQQFAANKMSSKMNRSMLVEKKSIQHAFNRAGAQREYLHIFNIEGGGYIIVSADDRTEEILGYSTTGTFDANQIPETMRAFQLNLSVLQEELLRRQSHPYFQPHGISGHPILLLVHRQKGNRPLRVVWQQQWRK